MLQIALDYALNRFTNIVDRLTVFEDNMRNNIDKTFGLIFSQRVLLALINKGMVREEAYDRVPQSNGILGNQNTIPSINRKG